MLNILLLLNSYYTACDALKNLDYKLYLYNVTTTKFENIQELDNKTLDYIDVIILNNDSKKMLIENLLNSFDGNKQIYLFSNLKFNITNNKCICYNFIKLSNILTTLTTINNIRVDSTNLNQNVVNQNVVNQNVVNQNVVRQNVVRQNVVRQNVVRQNVVRQNVVKQNVVTNNINFNKTKFRNLCLTMVDKFRTISIPEITLNKSKEAVLVEYRPLEHTEILLRNCISKLGADWSYTIVCGEDAFEFYKKLAFAIHENIKVINSGHKNIDQNTYNNFLLTKDFWDLLSGEKILIYQEDTFIFKDTINDFMEWDYIGAPFKMDCVEGNNVGNGGLSLRSKSKMIEALDRMPLESITKHEFKPFVQKYMYNKKLDNIPEDIYYSTYLQKLNIGKVPDVEIAKQFSSETIYNPDSFGMHCMWHSCKDWALNFTCINSSNTEYTNFPTLFHKYILNISNQYDTIPYKILSENKNNNEYICHIHMFDIDKSLSFMLEHIKLVKNYFNVIITFVKGNFELLINENITILQINNTGYDIGGKIVALEYMKNNTISYEYILFLHDKTNPQARNNYFSPLIKNSHRIKFIKTLISEKDVYGIFPNTIWYNVNNVSNHPNSYDLYVSNIDYYNEMLQFLKMNKYTVFSEGNCFICNKKLIDFIFKDDYNLFYNILNNYFSFDVNWFRIYYNCKHKSMYESYQKFIDDKLYGNNIQIHGRTCALPDGMIEHLFERLWINAIHHLNKKYIVLDSKEIVPMYNIKINAIYFPQFHEIPENNKFWGDGFTEWTLLKPFGTPQIINGNKYDILKPHIDIGYYDLAEKNTLLNQIECAKKYNINGFIIYHYWFDNNTKILYKPLERFLDSNINFPFCISWANETWSRRWDGSNKEVLIKQEYGSSPECYKKHINYLIPFFQRPNYIKTDNNECILYIYHFCKELEKIYDKMMFYWNEELEKYNIKIKVIITENSFKETHNLSMSNDKFMFEPMYSCSYVKLFKKFDFNKMLPENFDVNYYKSANKDLHVLDDNHAFTHFKNYGRHENRFFKYENKIYNNLMCINYNDIITNYKNNKYSTINKHLGLPLYWNNIVRRKNLPFLYVSDFNLIKLEELFIILLSKIVLRSANIYNINNINNYDNVININAWNEWNEQAVLEPNNITGYSNLQTLSSIIEKI